MTVIKLCGIAIMAVMMTVMLKQFRPEIATVMTAVTCVLLLSAAIACFSPVSELLSSLNEQGEGSVLGEFSSHMQMLVKALGIGILTQSTADICRDSGESAIASKIELAGKAEIFVLGLPLISELFDITRALLL